ncbi:DUF6011 domain-containing protein [[Mycobacterium] fortunisiensis]|uniref:DUF6011 domain-containing protein n=1 Tax=[Mycobacterium] fortunisiensis TaxID=2600579 RepID=UPI001FEB9BC3|nr:DUF6011 domain-containing protein [[Mycobacterium] fortunisiensis]
MTTQRKRPAPPQDRPSRNTTNAAKSTGHRRQDGYAAPDVDDRLDAQVIAEAEARGFKLATRCSACGHWLVSAPSVALHLGPVCRSKAGDR